MEKLTVRANIGTGLTKRAAGEKVVDFPSTFKEATDHKDWGEKRVLALAARSFVIDEQRKLRDEIESDPKSPTAIFKALSKEAQEILVSGDAKKIEDARKRGILPALSK